MDTHPSAARRTVAIVGGGTAGCATALALARRGIGNIVVLEAKAALPAFRIGETLPPASGLVLRRLGLFEAFQAQGHLVSAGSCASWGKAELGYNDFLFDPLGCGWHLDRVAFEKLLLKTVEARGIDLFRGHRLRRIEPLADGGYGLGFDAGTGGIHWLEAEFLVDATGVAVGAVRRLGVVRNPVDSLIVVCAVVELDTPDGIPSQSFLEGAEWGWWYAARLPGGKMVVALATDPPTLSAQGFRDAAAWRSALRQTVHIAELVERGRPQWTDRPPETAVAESAILSRVTGSRWLAVGDAASSYDPITAQGLYKALSDGETAGEAIAEFFGSGGDAALLGYQDALFERFTDYLRLREYLYSREQRWSRGDFWRKRLLRKRFGS